MKASVDLDRRYSVGLISFVIGIGVLCFVIQFTYVLFPYMASVFSFFYLSWVKAALLLSMMLVPIVVWYVYKAILRRLVKIKPIVIQKINLGLIGLIGAGVVGFALRLDWSFYYQWAPDQLITYLSPKTYLLALLFLVFGLIGRGWHRGRLIILGMMAGVAGYMANFVIINDIHRYNASALNLSVVMHSVVQVFLGKAILINQKSQYGLYAHFIEPILRLIGGVSELNFSIIMASLVFVSILSVGLFLWLTLKNKWIALVGFLATIYFQYFVGQLWPEELYLQYYPIRTIFPTLLLPLYYWYRIKPSKGRYYLLWILFATGILWNLDVGIFCYLALWATHVYHVVATKTKWKNIVREIIRLTGHAIFILVGVIVIFVGYEYIRYGAWSQLSELFSSQKLFLNEAVPKLNTPWVLIALLYLAGVVFAIDKLFEKEKSPAGEWAVLITIMGSGILTYYLNNTNESVLSICGYPAIILLTFLVEEGFIVRRGRLFAWIGLAILCFMSASFVQNLRFSRLVGDTETIQDIISPESSSAKSMWAVKKDCLTCVDFVYESDYARDRTLKPIWGRKEEYVAKYKLPKKQIRDDILILSNWDYLLYLSAYAKAPLKMVNFRHLYLESEWEELFSQITNHKSRYIIVDEEELIVVGAEKSHPQEKIEKLWESIKTNYHEVRREQVGDEYYDWQWHPNYLSTWIDNNIE